MLLARLSVLLARLSMLLARLCAARSVLHAHSFLLALTLSLFGSLCSVLNLAPLSLRAAHSPLYVLSFLNTDSCPLLNADRPPLNAAHSPH